LKGRMKDEGGRMKRKPCSAVKVETFILHPSAFIL